MRLQVPVAVRVAGLVVLLLGVAVLCGWAFDIGALKSVVPGLTTLKPTTAVAFCLVGLALCLLPLPRVGQALVTRLVAPLVLLLGVVELCQYLFDFEAGIDGLLFRVPPGASFTDLHPGRMTPQSTVEFVLLGGALVLIGQQWARTMAMALAWLAVVVPVLTIAGYLFGETVFVAVHYRPMGVHTAIGFLLAAMGILATQFDGKTLARYKEVSRVAVVHTVGVALAVATLALILDLWAGDPITFFAAHFNTLVAFCFVFVAGIGVLLSVISQLKDSEDSVNRPADTDTDDDLPTRIASTLWIPLWVLFVCLTLTYSTWMELQRDAQHDLKTAFDTRASTVIARIERRISGYGQLLQSVQGYFATVGGLDREHFHDYLATLRIEDYFPGAQATQYVAFVPAAEKERHIDTLRKGGFPQYTITPAGERAFYCPVVFVEPPTPLNDLSLGFDTCSEVGRLMAKQQARDQDELVLSGKLMLRQEIAFPSSQQAGIVMSLPVFKQGAAHDSVAARRANLQGWVTATFRMNDLMAGILKGVASGLDVEIYDGKEISGQALLFDYDNGRDVHGMRASALRAVQQINAANRTWTIGVYSAPVFEAGLERTRAMFVAVFGPIVSLMLALIAWLLVHGRELARRAARKMNRELLHNTELLRTTLESVEMGFAVWDVSHRLVLWNQKCVDFWYGFKDPHVGMARLAILRHIAESGGFGEGDTEQLARFHEQRLNAGLFDEEFTMTNGRVVQVGRHLLSDGRYAAVYQDIIQRKLEEERVRYLANYDSLTGLPNRALLSDRLQQAIARVRRENKKLAVLYLDLDHFKPVNDTFGHMVGDQLLKEVAQRLLACVRASDTAARLGGDEFVVLLPHAETRKDVITVAEKILLALDTPFVIEGHTLSISSSVGIALCPDHGDNDKLLLINADIAMYYAKSSGRDGFRFFPDAVGA